MMSAFDVGGSDSQPKTAAFETASVPSGPLSDAAPSSDGVATTSVASAPEYDDDHADELFYQPFPLLPMIADTSVASMDFSADTPDLLKKVHLFFKDPRAHLPLEFEPGLQYGELYWASRFSGQAVSRILTEGRLRREPAARRDASRLARR